MSSNLNSANPVTSELKLDERIGTNGFTIFLHNFFASSALEWLTQSTGKITASAEEIAPFSFARESSLPPLACLQPKCYALRINL